MDPVQIEIERAQEGLTGEEPDLSRDVSEVADPIVDLLVLDRAPDPDMVGDRATVEEINVLFPEPASSSGPLREDLVDVTVHLEHDLEDLPHEGIREIHVEEVRHGVDEDHPGVRPSGRL
jgi:hypothetical protein